MSGFEFVENVNFVLITFTGSLSVFFFFNDTATTEIYTLSLHDALPIFPIRFVEGMLLSGLIPVAMSMVGDTIPFEKQGRWIGLLTTAQAARFAPGPPIVGFFSQTLAVSRLFFASARVGPAGALVAMLHWPGTS